jgi:hypothetical protein
MSNGGLQQGPGGPLATQQMAQAATESAREVSLNAVRDDVNNMSDGLSTLDDTVQRLQMHLMGEQPSLKGEEDVQRAERPTPSGTLPMLCNMGSTNIRHLQRIQERLNQLCYELGEGR